MLATAIKTPFLENLISLIVFYPHPWCLGIISSQSCLIIRFPSLVPAATMNPPSSRDKQAKAVTLAPTLQTSIRSWVARSYEHIIP